MTNHNFLKELKLKTENNGSSTGLLSHGEIFQLQSGVRSFDNMVMPFEPIRKHLANSSPMKWGNPSKRVMEKSKR